MDSLPRKFRKHIQIAISTSICRSSVTICSGLYFFIGIPALLQSEFSLTSAGTKIPGQVI